MEIQAAQKKKKTRDNVASSSRANVATPRTLHFFFNVFALRMAAFFFLGVILHCTIFFTLQKLFNCVFVAAFTKRITVTDSWGKLWAQHLP